MSKPSSRISRFLHWLFSHAAWDALVECLKHISNVYVVITTICSLAGIVAAYFRLLPVGLQIVCFIGFAICVISVVLQIAEWWGKRRQRAIPPEMPTRPDIIRTSETPLEIEADRGEYRTGINGVDVHYFCRIRVHNKSAAVAENVQAKLTAWNPPPTIRYTGTTKGSKDAKGHDLPMPNDFPIPLKAEANQGAGINPGDSASYRLFEMIRTGGNPTVEILGREAEYRYFHPQPEPHSFEIQVSSSFGTVRRRFKLAFIRDEEKIPAFEVEKMPLGDSSAKSSSDSKPALTIFADSPGWFTGPGAPHDCWDNTREQILENGVSGKVMRINIPLNTSTPLGRFIDVGYRSCKTIEFIVQPESWSGGEFACSAQVKLLSEDHARADDFSLRISNGNEKQESKRISEKEWQIFLHPIRKEHGWISLKANLSETVGKAFAKEGWEFSEVVGVQLRGILTLSKINLYD